MSEHLTHLFERLCATFGDAAVRPGRRSPFVLDGKYKACALLGSGAFFD